jgi:hypothetical protein
MALTAQMAPTERAGPHRPELSQIYALDYVEVVELGGSAYGDGLTMSLHPSAAGRAGTSMGT